MNDGMIEDPGGHSDKWKFAAGCAVFASVILIFIFSETVRSAISIWTNSGAYNHCFLILPIFFYMLWCDRADMRQFSPRPMAAGILAILFFTLAWFLAHLSGIAEGGQFAFVGIIEGLLLTVFGWRVYLRFLLPFSYLWLLVPSGQFLIPGLQNVTAAASAALLDLTGIPTLRTGLTIDVPTGSYVVAPGCAGLNFLLAALATSLAYAELVYRSWGRRLGFVAGLLVLSVGGNILRVFLIIAIAHLTNNVGDIVDDHLVYGWGFFSFLLLAAMFLGQRFREDTPSPAPHGPVTAPAAVASRRAILVVATAALLVSATTPLAARIGWPDRPLAGMQRSSLPCAPLASTLPDDGWPLPMADVVDRLKVADCRVEEQNIHFVLAGLARPVRQGKLIGLDERLNADDRWNRVSRKLGGITLEGREIPVQIDLFALGSRRRLVLSLFRADGDWRRPGLATAIADLAADLTQHRRAALVQVGTEAAGGEEEALGRIGRFLSAQPLAALTAAAEGP